MVPGGFPLAEMQVATGVFRLDERATSVGVDRLIWVVGRTERVKIENQKHWVDLELFLKAHSVISLIRGLSIKTNYR